MSDARKGLHFFCNTDSYSNLPPVDFYQKDGGGNIGQIAETQQLTFSTSTNGTLEAVAFTALRCGEKGCVFPASPSGSGMCTYHMRQLEEPVLFCSRQPTSLLLDPVRTSPAEQEHEDSRRHDRRRMAAIWEDFQGDGTP